MTSYLYNGIELPALPETDKPYVVIFRGVTGAYYLKLSDTAITTDSDGNAVNPQYIANGTESWSENTVITVTGEVIWTNYDVYTTDGTLYLSASDPIPVGTPITDPLSFMMGWQLGQRLRMRGRKPIGYLYGGVQLPALPEVDGYGNKVLYLSNIGSRYKLALCADAMYYDVSNEKIKCPVESDLYFSTYYEDSGWTEPNLYTGYKNGNVASSPPIWVNTDMFDSDGNLYLAASEPVPVYE